MKRTIPVLLMAGLLSASLMITAVLPGAAAGGRLRINGSDTILPLASAWAEAYMNRHPDAMVSVTGGGSGVGIAALINGTTDIADASREVKASEITQGRDRNVTLKATTVARDGIAVIVNPRNPIKGVSMDELCRLYSGSHNWKEVGGQDMKVITAGRDSSSGTYVFFQDAVLHGRRYRSDMLTLPSNNAICRMVSQDEGAVGYVGLPFAKEAAAKHQVRIIAVNGVVASDESVRSGKYALWRPLYNYTNGRPGGLIGDYLKFVTSEEGQKIAEQQGYVAR
jgi:phosphate transport system substrate-binding protein